MDAEVKRAIVIGGGLLLLAAVAALVWLAAREEAPESEAPVAETEPAQRFPDVDPYEFFSEEGEPAPVPASGPGAMGFGREDWAGLSPEERRAKRREMRERWQNMPPEERRERRLARAARRVKVLATGEGEPDLEAVDVMDSVREVRPQIRECVQDNGGWRALREAAAAGVPDGGPRGPMTVAFDVSADGTVSGVDMQPPPPEGFAQCFQSAFQSIQLPPPNSDARVEVQLGGRRGGRGRVSGQRRAGD